MPSFNIKASSEWINDCLKWRGVILTGKFSHWCWDWDDLPIDETCEEWPCICFKSWWTRLKWRLENAIR